MIDTHCHIDCCEDVEDIINSFDGIIITSGYDDKSNLKVIDLVNKYPNVYGTLGIHPEEVDNDYNIDKQKELFIKQLDLAQEYNLPIVVHSRDAIEDTYNILKNYNLKGSIHCFSSSLEMARKFIDLGYKIGVGGVITFKNGKKLREVVDGISISDILTETDSPYLSPEPFRGRENKPSNVYYVIKEIASIKNMSKEEIMNITLKSAEEVFEKISKL